MNIFSRGSEVLINFLSNLANPFKLRLEEQLKNHYIKVIKQNPKDSDAYNNLGVLNFEFGNYKQSLKDLSKAISINSQYHHHIHYFCSAIYTYLGHINLLQKKTSNAIECYKKAIFQDHQNNEAQDFLNKTNIKDSDLRNSNYYLKIALDFDYFQISNLRYKNIMTVITKEENTLEDVIYKIDFLYQKSYFKEVIKFCTEAYKKYKYDKFLYYLASSYYHLKNYSESQKFFEKFLSKESINASAKYDYGYCLLARRNWHKASNILKILLKEDETEFVLFAYGLTCFFKKDYSKAKKYLSRSLKYAKSKHDEYHENSSNQHYNRGYIFYKTKNYDLALADLTKALDLQSTNIDASYLKAIIYFKKRNYSEAINSLEFLLRLNNNHQEAKTLKQKIERKLQTFR